MNFVNNGLCLFCHVANNYGVIDLGDGIIDWVSKEELIKYAKLVSISGVDIESHTIKPVFCRLDVNKCNWATNKTNIFTVINSIFFNQNYNGGDLVIITKDNKKFRGKVNTVSMQGETYRTVTFYGHIVVFFSIAQFDTLVERAV